MIFELHTRRFVVQVALLAAFPGVALPQSAPPRIFFSDLESGPNSGGENNAGGYVTIYGRNFGAARGSSFVTVGGGAVTIYPVWTDTTITFQLGTLSGSGSIAVTTPAGTSNSIPFTVRSGNIYFVATSGNDANAGSFTSPWSTLPHAVQTAPAGSIIYAMNGVSQTSDDGQGWDAALLLRSEWCSSSGDPRALIAYPGATVTIGNPNGSSPENGIRSTDFSASGGACGGYWVFSGLTFRGADPVAVNGPSSQWRFVGNDISCPTATGNGGGGACFETTLASNVKFYGNNVHDAGAADASALFQGVYFSTDSNHIDMGWNTVANIKGCRGIQIHSSPLGSNYPNSGFNQFDIAIHDNLIHDTQCDAIILDTIDPSKGPVSIYNNVIYNGGKGPNNPEQSGGWNCINVPGNSEGSSAGSGTVDIYNNTLYACGTFTSPPYNLENSAIAYNGGNPNLFLRLRNNLTQQVPTSLYPTGVPYVVTWNPSISNGGGVCADSDNCPWIQGTNNLFFGSGAAPANPNVTDSLNADPLFVNAAQNDFHLQPGSPAANAGVTAPQQQDFDGIPLPQGPGYPIGAYASVSGGPVSAPVSVTISPKSLSLSKGQPAQFSATVSGTSDTAVIWSISPTIGAISSTGLFTAPAVVSAQQSITVTATAHADASISDSATVTLLPPPAVVSVSVNPASVSLSGGQTQQFAATVSGTTTTAVTWSLSPAVGTLSSSGLYTAPATIGAQQTVTVKATARADTSKSDSATVTLIPPPTLVSVALSPASISMIAGQLQQFTATVSGTTNTAVTWSLSPAVGTLSSSGLYAAPATITPQQTVTVMADSVVDPTKSASATVTLNPPPAVSVSISPAAVGLAGGQMQQFVATVDGTTNAAVTWFLNPSVGTLSPSGLYTAPDTIDQQQTVMVTAVSAADATKSATAIVSLSPPTPVNPEASASISPAFVSLGGGQTVQFMAVSNGTASTAFTWSLTPAVGTLTSTGLYTAPASINAREIVTVKATSVTDNSVSANATVALTPAATGPYTVSLQTLDGNLLQVNWTAPTGSSADDRITLTSPGSPDWSFLWSRDTNGAPSGSFVVTMPSRAGLYEFRYYVHDTSNAVAYSAILPVHTDGFSIDVEPAMIVPGGELTVSWTAPDHRFRGWSGYIGFFPVEAPSDLPISIVGTQGQNSGTFTVQAPSTPGSYEFRYLNSGSRYITAALSAPVVLQ